MLRDRATNLRFTLLGCLLLWSAGCGPSAPRTVPVSGKISFGGQVPPARVVLTFVCLELESGQIKAPGTAEVKPDGSFHVTSFQPNDGLIPGKYQVNVECWKQEPTMEAPGSSHVPKTYSPPPLVVSSKEKSVSVNIDVPVGT